MTDDVFEQNTKKLTIEVASSATTIELGGTSWEKRKSNDISDFARPNTSGGNAERRAQNLNQIEENHIFNALVSDEFVQKATHEGLNLESKEDLEDSLDDFFESGLILRVQYGHVDEEGYLTEYNVDERSQNGNSVFSINFTLLVAEPMSGS